MGEVVTEERRLTSSLSDHAYLLRISQARPQFLPAHDEVQRPHNRVGDPSRTDSGFSLASPAARRLRTDVPMRQYFLPRSGNTDLCYQQHRHVA